MREGLKKRLPALARAAGGMLLLALLAVCGLAGSGAGDVRAVSVPVERAPQGGAQAAMSAAERLALDRQEEIALLDSVLESADADQGTRQNALAQKTQLAGRMELEAQARACLAGMGYERAQIVCGAQMMTVLLPGESVPDAAAGARIVSAVCDQTGADAADVKILLTD